MSGEWLLIIIMNIITILATRSATIITCYLALFDQSDSMMYNNNTIMMTYPYIYKNRHHNKKFLISYQN